MPRRTPIENVDEAFDAAIRLLARKSRTTSEVVRELESRGAPAEVVESAIARLKAHRHLDDAAYADDTAFKLLSGKGQAPARVVQELEARGVARPAIHEAVDAARDGRTDETLCKTALARRLNGKPLTPELAAKEVRALARLGYDPELVERVIERALAAAGTD